MTGTDRRPPRMLEALLSRILDGRDRDWILGDLREEHARVAAAYGRRRARTWYLRQLVRSVIPSARRRMITRGPGHQPPIRRSGARSFGLHARLILRQLVRTPLFTAGSILTLGLGLGLATAIFSVVNGVLLRPLPYRDAERLLWIWSDLTEIGVPRANTTGPQLIFLEERARTIEDFALMRVGPTPMTSVDGGDAEQVQVARSTTNLFALLGVSAARGRAFLEGEDGAAGEDVLVLSWGLWQRRFGGDPAIIGQQVMLNDAPHTVVGVMPGDFRFAIHTSLGAPVAADAWATIRQNLADMPTGSLSFSMLARVRPESSVDAAVAELRRLGPEMRDHFGFKLASFTLRPVQLVPDLVGGVRRALIVLQAAVLLLLGAVLAGQVALLIARADHRRRELTIARALGAGSPAIVRLILLESTLLAALGGTAGLLTALLALPRFLALAPENLPRREEIALDATVLAVAIGASLLFGLVAGLLPALRTGRDGIATTLRSLSVPSGSASSRRTRRVLVAAQLALSFVLVAGAALLVRSMSGLLRLDPGFATSNVLTFEILMARERYEELPARVALVSDLRERIGGLPGVTGIGATSGLPLAANSDQSYASFPGSAITDASEDQPLVDVLGTTPGYFDAMGIVLDAGRDFAPADDADAPPVAIIDRVLARRHFPAGDAVGRIMTLNEDSLTIVGVVAHGRLYDLDTDGRGQVWLPYSAAGYGRIDFAVRHSRDADALIDEIRAIVRDADASLPIATVATIEHRLRDALGARRLAFGLITAFGVVALLLAIIGTYTMLASTVAQRAREIGVRLAIGARPGEVVALVMRNAAGVLLTGIASGIVLSLIAMRALRGLLFGIAPTDPLTLALTAAGLAALGFLAAVVPAARASRIDPARTLREE